MRGMRGAAVSRLIVRYVSSSVADPGLEWPDPDLDLTGYWLRLARSGWNSEHEVLLELNYSYGKKKKKFFLKI